MCRNLLPGVTLGPDSAGVPPRTVVGDLGKALAPFTQNAVFARGTAAVEVVDVHSGERVFGWNPDQALVPASVMKVLTTATALDELGPVP